MRRTNKQGSGRSAETCKNQDRLLICCMAGSFTKADDPTKPGEYGMGRTNKLDMVKRWFVDVKNSSQVSLGTRVFQLYINTKISPLRGKKVLRKYQQNLLTVSCRHQNKISAYYSPQNTWSGVKNARLGLVSSRGYGLFHWPLTRWE